MGIIGKLFGGKKKKKKNHRLANSIRLENQGITDEELWKLVDKQEQENAKTKSEPKKNDEKKEKRHSFDPEAKQKYRELKKQRSLAAQKKRQEDARRLELEEKNREEQLKIRKKEQEEKLALERQAQKLMNEKKEEAAKARRLQKEEEERERQKNVKVDVYADYLAPINRGDSVPVEIVGKEKDIYFCQAVSNGQEILLPEIELEGHKVAIGDVLEVKIYKKYAGDLFASYRRLINEEKVHQEMSEMDDVEIVNGTVTAYKRFNFEVTLSNGLKGNVYIKNMDTSFIEDGEPYVGKNFKFKIIERDETNHNAQFELSRRDLLLEEQAAVASEIKSGEEIVADEITWNKGGINFKYKGITGFVPMRELSYKYYASVDEAASEIVAPLKIKIKEVKFSNKKVDLIGSVKDLQEDPWESLAKKYKEGQQIEGIISRVERYGIFVPIDFGINGLLHQSVMLDEMRKSKVGDKIKVEIEKIDLEKKQINLIPFLEK